MIMYEYVHIVCRVVYIKVERSRDWNNCIVVRRSDYHIQPASLQRNKEGTYL
jgi:hypothetical protein